MLCFDFKLGMESKINIRHLFSHLLFKLKITKPFEYFHIFIWRIFLNYKLKPDSAMEIPLANILYSNFSKRKTETIIFPDKPSFTTFFKYHAKKIQLFQKHTDQLMKFDLLIILTFKKHDYFIHKDNAVFQTMYHDLSKTSKVQTSPSSRLFVLLLLCAPRADLYKARMIYKRQYQLLTNIHTYKVSKQLPI